MTLWERPLPCLLPLHHQYGIQRADTDTSIDLMVVWSVTTERLGELLALHYPRV